MEIVSYPTIFIPKDNEIQVDFLDLPEAFTQRKIMDEAIDFIKLGLAVTLNDKPGHFEEAPSISSLEVLEQQHPDQIIKMATVDLEQY